MLNNSEVKVIDNRAFFFQYYT